VAKNRRYAVGNQLSVAVPSGKVSGDPVVYGQRPGVCLTDRGAHTAGEATVAFDGVFDLSVKGENNAGNVAVAEGDILYYTEADTPKVNKDSTTGVRFGYAHGTVTSGATATIPVKVGY
jgi:predicted RecA/RadA family phage recombinase